MTRRTSTHPLLRDPNNVKHVEEISINATTGLGVANPGRERQEPEGGGTWHGQVNLDELSTLLRRCDEHISRLGRVGRLRGKTADRAVLIITVIATALLPFAGGVLLEHMPENWETGHWLTVGIIGLIQITLGGFSIWGVSQMGILTGLVGEVDSLRSLLEGINNETYHACTIIANTEGLLKTAVNQVVAILSSLTTLRGILGTSHPEADEKELVEKLLFPLVRDRHDVLGFHDPSDLYNIAVYIWKKETKSLECLYRACDERIDRRDRTWRPGQGHVGICYSMSKVIITPDVADAPEFLSTDQERDLEYYRSIAAFPMHGISERGIPSILHPIGVLVITSSKPGHLYKGYQMVGQTYAEMLSLCLGHLQTQTQMPVSGT